MLADVSIHKSDPINQHCMNQIIHKIKQWFAFYYFCYLFKCELELCCLDEVVFYSFWDVVISGVVVWTYLVSAPVKIAEQILWKKLSNLCTRVLSTTFKMDFFRFRNLSLNCSVSWTKAKFIFFFDLWTFSFHEIDEFSSWYICTVQKPKTLFWMWEMGSVFC